MKCPGVVLQLSPGRNASQSQDTQYEVAKSIPTFPVWELVHSSSLLGVSFHKVLIFSNGDFYFPFRITALTVYKMSLIH